MNWMERRRRKARRRYVAGTFGVIWVVTLVVASVGMVLPPAHAVGNTRLLPRSPEMVWRVLTDLDGMPRWRSDVAAVERLPDRGGRVAWREIGTRGALVFELEAAEAPTRLVVRRVGPDGTVAETRRYLLEPADTGTLIAITDLRSYANPIARVLVRLPIRTSSAAVFLSDLAGRFRPAAEIVAGQED